jgi:hypothetical protein
MEQIISADVILLEKFIELGHFREVKTPRFWNLNYGN